MPRRGVHTNRSDLMNRRDKLSASRRRRVKPKRFTKKEDTPVERPPTKHRPRCKVCGALPRLNKLETDPVLWEARCSDCSKMAADAVIGHTPQEALGKWYRRQK